MGGKPPRSREQEFAAILEKTRQDREDPLLAKSLAIGEALDLNDRDLPEELDLFGDPKVLLICAHLEEYSWQRREQTLELLRLLEMLPPRKRAAAVAGIREYVLRYFAKAPKC